MWLHDLWDEEVALCKQFANAVHPHVAHVALTCVCRRWRDIALNLTPFWTSYYFLEQYHLPHCTGQADATYVKQWMERTGDRPMNIIIHSRRQYTLRAVFQKLLVDYTARVVSVHLVLYGDTHSAFLLDLSSMPNLEKVTIRTHRTCWIPSKPLTVLENSLSLKHVALETLAGQAVVPTLPWSQLQSLSFKAHYNPFSLDTRAVLNILQHCQSLRSFSFVKLSTCDGIFESADAFMENPVVHVTHHSLRTLVLSADRNVTPPAVGHFDGDRVAKVDVSELLAGLTAPNLQSFDYRWVIREEFEALESFLHRSSYNLKSLNILPAGSVDIRDSALLSFQKPPPLPHLEELFLSSSVDESFTDALADSSSMMCPNLRRISIQIKRQISAKALVSILRSRTYDIPQDAGVVRLDFVDLIYFKGRKRHIPKEELCRMQQAGTVIVARRKRRT